MNDTPVHGTVEPGLERVREHYERIAQVVAGANQQDLERLAAEVLSAKS